MQGFGDSFDLYSVPADASGYWDGYAAGGGPSLVAGRFSGSQAFSMATNAQLIKASSSNDAIHHITLAYLQTAALSGTTQGPFFTFRDGGTAQCTVAFRSDGALQLLSGGNGGTVLDTWTGAVSLANQWFAFEIEVVINNASGSWTIRKNGNTGTPDHTLGSLNTRGGTANNYAQQIFISMGTGFGAYLDDLLWRSDPASVPWLGDIRCYVRMPSSDAQAQMSRSGVPAQAVTNGTGVYNAWGANTAHYFQFTATYSGQVATATWNTGGSASGTANVKCAIFTDNAGVPGTLLATSNVIANPVVNQQTVTFASPPTLVAGQTYWFAENQDGSYSANAQSVAGSPSLQVTSSPFSTWPASNPSLTGSTSGVNQHAFTLNYTLTGNYGAVQELHQDALATYVYDFTVGHNDLYGIAAIPGPAPPSVVCVTTRALAQKSDAGSRSGAVQLKSGSATVQSPSSTLVAGSWAWLWRTDFNDPNTSAPWTVANVNNVQIGPVLTA
jgi:hypothetical protein